MKVQYEAKPDGRLLVKHNSGMTLILCDAYWDIHRTTKNEGTDYFELHPRAPTIEIPGRLFAGLYFGIRRYHHKQGEIYRKESCKQEAQEIFKHIENLETQLIKILEKDGRQNLEPLLWFRRLQIAYF